MKQTLLNSAGALALVVALASSAALAADNEAAQFKANLAVQDFLNGSENNNGSHNDLYSGNDNDGLDLDADVTNSFNDKSHDDDDGVDFDLEKKEYYSDKSTNYKDRSKTVKFDHSLDIEDIAIVVSAQHLEAAAAAVEMYSERGDLTTGGVSYGDGANTMAAGNMTTSNNTGAGTVAQAAAGIQANGRFNVGR